MELSIKCTFLVNEATERKPPCTGNKDLSHKDMPHRLIFAEGTDRSYVSWTPVLAVP